MALKVLCYSMKHWKAGLLALCFHKNTQRWEPTDRLKSSTYMTWFPSLMALQTSQHSWEIQIRCVSLSIIAGILTCLESEPTTCKSCCNNEAWHCLWAASSSSSLSPSLCAWGWPQPELRACFCCGAKQPQASAKQLPVLSLAAVCKMADLMRQLGAAGFGCSSGTSDYSHKLGCEWFVPQRPFSPRWTPLKFLSGSNFLAPGPALHLCQTPLCPSAHCSFLPRRIIGAKPHQCLRKWPVQSESILKRPFSPAARETQRKRQSPSAFCRMCIPKCRLRDHPSFVLREDVGGACSLQKDISHKHANGRLEFWLQMWRYN